jgi:hypothetical protein
VASEPVDGKAVAIPAAGSRPATPGKRLCGYCRHSRRWVKPELFTSAELQTAGGLKALGEWEQQEKQHANRETLMVGNGDPFTFEPHHYAWCAFYSRLALVEAANGGDEDAAATLMREGGASLIPVSGAWTPFYALCQRMNPKGDCEKHEPR